MKNIFLKMNLALGLVLALTAFVLYPVCENLRPDGTHMNCFYAGIFVSVMGIFVMIFSLASIWQKKLAVVSYVLAIAAAALSWLAPNGIVNIAGESWKVGLCSMSSHACVADTMPKVAIIAAAILVSSFAGLIFGFIREN